MEVTSLVCSFTSDQGTDNLSLPPVKVKNITRISMVHSLKLIVKLFKPLTNR